MNILPRSAYIHVPFCKHRCGYCNFTLVTGRDDLIDAYLDALSTEIARTLEEPQEVDTIFLGGGTPSYLTQKHLEQLLKLISNWFKLNSVSGEYSCEANPHDCSTEQLATLKAGGINRISLGGQSFDNAKLETLERDHTGAQLQDSIERCCESFDNVSLDLIFAAPGEETAQWECDIQRALETPVSHVSTYGLTIERGSAFYGRLAKQQFSQVECETQLQMFEHAIDALSSNGFEHYEVSNFALPEFRCAHNENYWLGEAWWAFGPGAASFSIDSNGSARRDVNHRSTTTYLKKLNQGLSPVAETESLSRDELLREKLVFGLRRIEGVDLTKLEKWWGQSIEPVFQPFLDRYIENGWLQADGSKIRLTRSGLVISDSLWPSLLTGQD